MMEVIYRYDPLCGKLKDVNIAEIEKLTRKTLGYYPELSRTKGLIYFHPLSDLKNRVAMTIPLRYPGSIIKTEFPYLAPLCMEFPDLDFVFHFWKSFLIGNEIKKTIDISHEFQHAAQFKNKKKTYLYGCIARQFLNKLQIPEETIPIEYDAIRKSKIVSTALFGMDPVEAYIEIMMSSANIKKSFVAVLKSIDISREYSLEKEVSDLWSSHHIEQKINELKNKQKRSYKEDKIIEMYNFADRQISA